MSLTRSVEMHNMPARLHDHNFKWPLGKYSVSIGCEGEGDNGTNSFARE